MTLARYVKQSFERLTGLHLHRTLPRGVDFAYDVVRSLPRLRIETVFDVGAHMGQSVREFRRAFPVADIHCFEPVDATFKLLQSMLAHDSRSMCHRLAMAAEPGRREIAVGAESSMSGFREHANGRDMSVGGIEMVEVDTLDRFCAMHGVLHINLLKIDTEGGDLDVLKGGEGLIGSQCVDLIQVEAGMSPSNTWHVPFDAFRDHLAARGYALFALYHQVPEWPTGEPHLRRVDAMFVSGRVIADNRAIVAPAGK
ncbi:MAG: FkbM family methyltransferase [Chromatiales bacterium]|jgi:FkbM family methyltransferase|nr:FkbM family methyltransferase [Chromatiales bacterium]MDX9767801.1 FkbM family methyltransferase [Ectothiorhodospiraceae bacterium]